MMPVIRPSSAALRRAFTYVELTIVAATIAMLVAIAVPNFLEAKVRTVFARSKAELATVKMAVEAYRVDHRAWPQNRTPGVAGDWDLVVLTTPVPYLSFLPYDVFTTPDGRGVDHPRPIEPAPYRYYNGAQVDEAGGVKFPPGQIGYAQAGYTAALLWGMGPGHARNLLYLAPAIEFDTQGALLSFPIYDPSNGTTSAGDLYVRIP